MISLRGAAGRPPPVSVQPGHVRVEHVAERAEVALGGRRDEAVDDPPEVGRVDVEPRGFGLARRRASARGWPAAGRPPASAPRSRPPGRTRTRTRRAARTPPVRPGSAVRAPPAAPSGRCRRGSRGRRDRPWTRRRAPRAVRGATGRRRPRAEREPSATGRGTGASTTTTSHPRTSSISPGAVRSSRAYASCTTSSASVTLPAAGTPRPARTADAPARRRPARSPVVRLVRHGMRTFGPPGS